MKYKLIYIEWEDCCANGSWMDEEEFSKWTNSDRYIIKQTGFVYKETKEHLILFSGFHDENGDYKGQYHHCLRIPKTWIRKRIDLTKHIK